MAESKQKHDQRLEKQGYRGVPGRSYMVKTNTPKHTMDEPQEPGHTIDATDKMIADMVGSK